MVEISIQVQSVLYNNSVDSLHTVAVNLANAARVAKDHGYKLHDLKIVYGDASETPVFTQQQFAKFSQEFSPSLEMEYIFFNENTGHAKGQNMLAENGSSQYILILNPDVVVSPWIFAKMVEAFSKSEHVGIIEARQTPFEHPKEYNRQTSETNWACGACILIPRDIFKTLGGFDWQSFYMYGDDVDFSWRVRLAGYSIIYLPSVPVFHSKHVTNTGSWISAPAEEYYSAEAALFMAYKWSNIKLLDEILAGYLIQPEATPQRKAAEVFLQKKQYNKLPQQLDPKHTVAEFTNSGYGFNRFIYNS